MLLRWSGGARVLTRVQSVDGAPSSIGLAKTAAQSTFVPYHQQAYVQSLQKVKFKGSSGAARHAPVQGGTWPANRAAFAYVYSPERPTGWVCMPQSTQSLLQ